MATAVPMSHVEDRWYKRDAKGRLQRTVKHGQGLRYRARWTTPDGKERSKSFPDRQLEAARNFLTTVDHSKLTGYRDPDAGKVLVQKYTEEVFLPAQGFDPATRERVESAFRVHIFPALGAKTFRDLEAHPSLIEAWVNGLPLAPSSASRVFVMLITLMRWTLRDKLITANPCTGIKRPKAVRRRVEPWTPEITGRVRAGLPGRYRALVDAGGGLGLRQGELFGMSVEHTDFLRRQVHVRQQVKLVGGRQVYAPPKSKEERTVPMAAQTAAALAAHLAEYSAVPVTLPWHEPGTRRHGKPHTAALLFTDPDSGALNRNSTGSHDDGL